MSKLEDKAKTYKEIHKEIIEAKCQWKDLTLEKRLQKQEWVLLSEANQDHDEIYNDLCEVTREKVQAEEHLKELKQKIREIIEDKHAFILKSKLEGLLG